MAKKKKSTAQKSLKKSTAMKSKSTTKAKPVAKLNVKRAAKSAAKTKSKTKTKPAAKLTPKTATKSAAKVKPKAKSAVKPKSVSKPKAAAKSTAAIQTATFAKSKSTADYAKAVTPLADRILVRLMTSEKTTPSGLIIIPDTVSTVQGHLKGEVLAVGTGARSKKGVKRPMDVTVGDQVLFDQYASTKIQFQGEDLHIVRESDVVGVVK